MTRVTHHEGPFTYAFNVKAPQEEVIKLYDPFYTAPFTLLSDVNATLDEMHEES